MNQILVLLLVSAVIAYLGDSLGTWIGKRRLSVFGLRPRVTAILITISTGMCITLFTLLTAAMLSENVKTALFYVESLKAERATLATEREALASDVTRLKGDRDQLQNEVKQLQDQVRFKEQALILFRRDELLTALVIKASQSREVVASEVNGFLRSLTEKARTLGLEVQDEERFLTDNRQQLDRMVEHIASSAIDIVVGAVAGENVTKGGSLGNVRFIVRPNNLICRADQEIAAIQIDGREDRGRIARLLQDFMEELNHEVVKQGMIGNPLTGRFGDLSSESMLSFFDMVGRIRALGRPLSLIAVVKADTYAIGPLEVSFRIEEE